MDRRTLLRLAAMGLVAPAAARAQLLTTGAGAGGFGPAGPAVTMDPAFLSGGVTLTNGNLSVLRPASTGWTLARGTKAITSGGFNFEVRADAYSSVGNNVMGIIDSTLAASAGEVGDTSHSGGILWNGGTYYNGSGTASGWTNIPVGTWIGICYIVASKNLHAYNPNASGPGGTFWDSGAGVIATDTGGRNLTSIGGTVYPGWSQFDANAQATFNFGATAFAYTTAAGQCLAAGYPAYKDA